MVCDCRIITIVCSVFSGAMVAFGSPDRKITVLKHVSGITYIVSIGTEWDASTCTECTMVISNNSGSPRFLGFFKTIRGIHLDL